MNGAEPGRDRLLDEAIDLLIRLQNDPGNPVSTEMIRAWRAGGPDHERAWAQVSGIHGVTGKVLTDRRKAERRQSLGLTRRNLVIGAIAGLGAAGAGYAVLPDLLIQARADVVTAKGEIRQVALPDGSMATLGPASALAFRFTPGRRGVELLTGMAYFDVRPEPQRPFAVVADDLTVTALGTAFDTSSDAGFLTVSVDHGLVEARAPDSALAAGVRLAAGDWITFDPAANITERGRREAGQIATWRDRILIVEKEPISAVVARIGRWTPGRIVLADPGIGRQRISGVFDLSDPRLALEAVVHPAGARVRQVSSILTVISPV